jgi:hypothetical protein
MMEATMNNETTTGREVTLPSGQVLTDTDFDAMATEAETAEYDLDRLDESSARRGGRPSLGNGPSSVLQIRLDAQTRARLTERATKDHRTPSSIAREAIESWLDAAS